eukprot:scaffold110_cov315-Pavlova_lutheri.AAC.34
MQLLRARAGWKLRIPTYSRCGVPAVQCVSTFDRNTRSALSLSIEEHGAATAPDQPPIAQETHQPEIIQQGGGRGHIEEQQVVHFHRANLSDGVVFGTQLLQIAHSLGGLLLLPSPQPRVDGPLFGSREDSDDDQVDQAEERSGERFGGESQTQQRQPRPLDPRRRWLVLVPSSQHPTHRGPHATCRPLCGIQGAIHPRRLPQDHPVDRPCCAGTRQGRRNGSGAPHHGPTCGHGNRAPRWSPATLNHTSGSSVGFPPWFDPGQRRQNEAL